MKSQAQRLWTRVGAALLAIVSLVVLTLAMPALASPIAPGALVPALDVYIDSLVLAHGAAAACVDAKSPARNATDWQHAKAVLIATLWAGGFPIDFVRTTGARLDAAPAAPPPDCKAAAVTEALAIPDHEGWTSAIGYVLAGMDLNPLRHPVSMGDWGRIKSAFAADIPEQKRLLDCVAVVMPEQMPAAVHDWDQMLSDIGARLVGAGLPRDDVSAQLSTAEANQLWHRAAPDAEAGLRDSCARETAWRDRLNTMGYIGLRGTIEQILPPAEGGIND